MIVITHSPQRPRSQAATGTPPVILSSSSGRPLPRTYGTAPVPAKPTKARKGDKSST